MRGERMAASKRARPIWKSPQHRHMDSFSQQLAVAHADAVTLSKCEAAAAKEHGQPSLRRRHFEQTSVHHVDALVEYHHLAGIGAADDIRCIRIVNAGERKARWINTLVRCRIAFVAVEKCCLQLKRRVPRAEHTA